MKAKVLDRRHIRTRITVCSGQASLVKSDGRTQVPDRIDSLSRSRCGTQRQAEALRSICRTDLGNTERPAMVALSQRLQ